MPSINDRIGSQNVIRVLSNASAPPSRLINLISIGIKPPANLGFISINCIIHS